MIMQAEINDKHVESGGRARGGPHTELNTHELKVDKIADKKRGERAVLRGHQLPQLSRIHFSHVNKA